MKLKKMAIIAIPITIIFGAVYISMDKDKTNEKVEEEVSIEKEVKDDVKQSLKTEVNRFLNAETVTYTGKKKISKPSLLFGEEIPLEMHYVTEKKEGAIYMDMTIKGQINIPNKIKPYDVDLNIEILDDKKEQNVQFNITDFKKDWNAFKEKSGIYIEEGYLASMGLKKEDYQNLLDEADNLFVKKYGRKTLNDKEYLVLGYITMQNEYGYGTDEWTNYFADEKNDYLKILAYTFGEKEAKRIIKEVAYRVIENADNVAIETGEWALTNAQIIEYIENEIKSKEEHYLEKVKDQSITTAELMYEKLKVMKSKQDLEKVKKINISRSEQTGVIEKIVIQEGEEIVWEVSVLYQAKGRTLGSGIYDDMKRTFGYGKQEEEMKNKIEKMKKGQPIQIEKEEVIEEKPNTAVQQEPIGNMNALEKEVDWIEEQENRAADGNIYVNYEGTVEGGTAKKQTIKNQDGSESILTYEEVRKGVKSSYYIIWEGTVQIHHWEVLDNNEQKIIKGYYEDGIFKEKE